jgi:glycosyltransferase involved in cell wall biosynthesis
MPNPKVSVIIPTHDRPELVPGAVRSVFAQTFKDIEIIVVDVGVKSRAKEVLVEFLSDSRFRYVEHPTELLGGAARNVGAKLATGEYLAFLDDDDEWLPEKLEMQMNALNNASRKAGFCFSAVVNDYGEGKQIISRTDDGEKDLSEIAYSRMKGFLTVTLIIRKTVFDEVGGFDEALPSHQDPELILRIAQKWTGVGVNKPLVRVNMRSDHDSVGKSFTRRIRGREMVIAKHIRDFEKRPKVLARHYFQLGLWNRDSGEPQKAAEYFKKSVRLSGNPRYLYHWMKTSLRLIQW